jgi:hypothetical protein
MHSACEKPVGKGPGGTGFLHRSHDKQRFATFLGKRIARDHRDGPVCYSSRDFCSPIIECGPSGTLHPTSNEEQP